MKGLLILTLPHRQLTALLPQVFFYDVASFKFLETGPIFLKINVNLVINIP